MKSSLISPEMRPSLKPALLHFVASVGEANAGTWSNGDFEFELEIRYKKYMHYCTLACVYLCVP